jgi:hypothetical protein
MKRLETQDAAIKIENSEVVGNTSVLMELLCHEHKFCKQMIRNYEAELPSLPKGSLCKKMINERAYL